MASSRELREPSVLAIALDDYHQYRFDRPMTVARLAYLTGFSERRIVAHLNKRPISEREASRYAEVLDCEVSDLRL